MKRLERTQQALARACADQGRGLDAAELAELLGAARHNVSADLNLLWREGLAVKVNGRPVLFWDPAVYKQVHGGAGAPGPAAAAAAPVPPPTDPLSELIGASESLRSQVEQAKAAVLYPPAGLHTLLVGPTGVGKSFLAERMHTFALASGRLPPTAPFVTLNCADYANNPQLLMAHLFGAVKGAYTGADRDREGLVDRADGGILFLDEVHRLPPEGQEMLFRLIDKGLFRRLGDSGPERGARVMLIAATTERIDSALLRTFTRRIPMVITLPALAERTAVERFRFIRRMLRSEAAKIGVDIAVPQEILRMLLEYECLGNIGQLHNDIQLTCARLFLSYLTSPRESMEVAPAHLPEHIHRTVPPVRHRRPEVDDLLRSLGGRLLVRKFSAPTFGGPGDHHPAESPISFYELIERQMEELRERGVTPAEAEQIVQRNIEGHFRDFVDRVRQRQNMQRQELSKLVGGNILRAVEKALLWAEEQLGRTLPERILYALALHLHACLERASAGAQRDLHLPMPNDDSPETRVAAGMVDLLSRELGSALPTSDVAFVTMLLRPEAEGAPADEQVSVLVVAHGRVASAMVDVAHALTGVNLALAVDMPLEQEPSAVADSVTAMAREGRFPGGLLLLVDMGSLETIGDTVSQAAGIPVRTIAMASSPLVLEAVHQASIPGATLDQVYQSVLTARSTMLGRDSAAGLPEVVLTFCFTGVGSAQTMARIVRESLADVAPRVDIIPASIGAGAGWTRLVSTLVQAHRLLALVGPVNPRIPGVPYISTEEMVVGHGGRRLRRLVEEGTRATESRREVAVAADRPVGDQAPLFAQMAASLGEHLKVTNPASTVPVIAKGLNAIEQYLDAPLGDELRVGLMMHLVCLLDRKVRDRLSREAEQGDTVGYACPLPWLPEALREMTDLYHVRLTPDELDRLSEVISGSVSAANQVSS